ncbi:MAG: hypothetical protein K6B41_14340 [Butyrivibrio sp.]|nr:hypothetical protein [Butyrivibrio sp.]
MIKAIDAEIFTVYDEPVWEREQLLDFYKDHDKSAILEFINNGKHLHVTYEALIYEHIQISDIRISISSDMFKKAFMRSGKEARWIACDENGQYQTVLQNCGSYYLHRYDNEGELDLGLINNYDTIVLYGLNEFAVELYMKALPLWKGHRIILAGDWICIGRVLKNIPGKEILIQNNYVPGAKFEIDYPNTLHVMDILPENEDVKRFEEENILTIDELMIYTFFFSELHHYGEEYPDKKFIIVNGYFKLEGIFGIQDKINTVVKYAISKGYIPVVILVGSEENMYSDFYKDDIWDKFMNQPYGYSMIDIKNAKNVYLSPNANCLNVMRYILSKEIKPDIVLDTDKEPFNKNVEDYISKHSDILSDPEETLGVLIRGTDYVRTRMPGHNVQAGLQEIVDKIAEVEAEHPYKYIYLATEDQEIFDIMKDAYGDRLIYTDQERFTINKGQLLIELHGKDTKEKGKGFRLGAEYLLTLRLLSRCESFIASGYCGGTTEALRENDGKYRFVYVFDKGINARK